MAENKNIKKLSRNLWEGRYYYLDNNKKKKYKEYFGKTKKEVATKLKELEKIFGKEPIKLTFAEGCDIWLENKQSKISPKSFTQYKTRVEKNIKVYFWEKNFFEVNQKDLEQFEEELCKNLKSKTVINIMQITTKIIKDLRLEQIQSKIKSSKDSESDLIILTSEDAKKLINYVNKDVNEFSLAIIIVLFTGISLSEICALKWSDIDFTKKSIKINKVLSRIGNIDKNGSKTQLVITEIPERNIPISRELFKYLNQFTLRNGYITTGTEKPIVERTMQYRLKSVCQKNNITKCSFSVLRNTFIVNALKNGCSIVLLASILNVKFSQLEKYFSLVELTNRNKISQISKVTY